MPYIYVEKSVPLYYKERGTGKPIVFIHPPGMGNVAFHRQHVLSSSFRVITYDLRGNGKSGTGTSKITMNLLANDLHKLFHALQIERAIVCGYSNGGAIAQHFALSYPHQVEKLILIGGFSEVCTHLLYLEFLLGIYTVKYHGIPLLAKVLGQAHGKTKNEKKMLEQYARLCDRQRLYEMYAEGLHYCSTHRLYELNMPILLIYGALDYYVHEYARIFQQHAQHVDIVYVENAKHQIPTKHADELNAMIRAYH
jgi:pimeloyl-ACP methyl ester carboxylesterase